MMSLRPYSSKLAWCKTCWMKKWSYLINLRWHSSGPRRNAVNIQMLSENLHKQIFGANCYSQSQIGPEKLKFIKDHLKRHGLPKSSGPDLPDVDLKLPPLHGETVEDHFFSIAQEQTKDYLPLIRGLADSPLPPFPVTWQFQKGWTKYFEDGTFESVPFPEENCIVFDIETLVCEGNYPTMATAVSQKHWYSWVSEYVIEDKFRWTSEPELQDLITLETLPGKVTPEGGKWQPRLVVGHNVGFDRGFVREQYFIQGTELRFLDTMSMHIAVCGQTLLQRKLWSASGKDSHRKEVLEHAKKQELFNRASSEEWKKVSSMNNLQDVHQLHCGGPPLEKTKRDVFVVGTMTDVREQFQELMTYCAKDVRATHEVFKKLWSEFNVRFPHPVTLAGMLEMGSGYLPVNSAWQRYTQQASATYDELQRDLRQLLMGLADEACLLMVDEEYKNDPWLWNLDWSTLEYRLNQTGSAASDMVDPFPEEDTEFDFYVDRLQSEKGEEAVAKYKEIVRKVYSTASRVPKNPIYLAGYPEWYRNLCPRPNDPDFYPGPSNISVLKRVTPKLMRLTWNGFPVHYDSKYGWGYLVPYLEELTEVELKLREQETEESSERQHSFPLQAFLDFLQGNDDKEGKKTTTESNTMNHVMNNLCSQVDSEGMHIHEMIDMWETARDQKPKKGSAQKVALGPFNIDIPCVRFYKIPHKNGMNHRVGNPLAGDFLNRSVDGTLRATGSFAGRAFYFYRMCYDWKCYRKRILDQMCVWMNKKELDRTITRSADYEDGNPYGAIIPRIVTAGTITRRAVEPTWLTSGYAREESIGSEVRSMIQCPPGYHFVGADVDSQELWIAAVLGDAFFMQEHGCSAMGWMILQGSKADKTDFHSKTAKIAGISRKHAKEMNYARIYGASRYSAARLLKMFNPQLSDQEARLKAAKMYKETKGQKYTYPQNEWIGGTESFMYNALERIANSECPSTPVLGCRISKALEPQYVLDDFLNSRMNWVVQSSAVDYLHLMLVCMRWLIKSCLSGSGRFCVSIHDEVRYLVPSKARYQAALALQITNLLTRSMFAHRLGMRDLPQSVAFFSAVDIDKCLRKEVDLDCITPSNPLGMFKGYDIQPGESLDIHQIIEKTGGKLRK